MAKIDTVLHGFSMGTSQGNLAFCGVTLIEGTKRILVDVAHNGRRQNLLDELKTRGLTPDDIDYVFLTHAHWDHMLNIDMFKKSKVLISSVEREYIKNPRESDFATTSYTSHIIESCQLQEVRDGEELDDGVSVMATPGHSKGSHALLVRNGDSVSAICGDALPNGGSVVTGMPRIVFWDVEDARKSITRLLERAQSFYPGHDRPFRVGDANKVTYIEPTSIRIFGWPEAGEGEGGPGISYAAEAPGAPRIYA
ncbi:MAG TPA: MBL fold metallo-hydrolase [Dehalococcoidia bacterium]|nr:MBL fold metallo-hydrolase [Dehalococcoidia bacterium]